MRRISRPQLRQAHRGEQGAEQRGGQPDALACRRHAHAREVDADEVRDGAGELRRLMPRPPGARRRAGWPSARAGCGAARLPGAHGLARQHAQARLAAAGADRLARWADAAARLGAQALLHDAVLAGVVRDHDQAAARAQRVHRCAEALLERAELVVHGDAQRLEHQRGRVMLRPRPTPLARITASRSSALRSGARARVSTMARASRRAPGRSA